MSGGHGKIIAKAAIKMSALHSLQVAPQLAMMRKERIEIDCSVYTFWFYVKIDI